MTTTATTTYDFDAEFQTEIVALSLRDPDFNVRANGLVKPDYFANEAEASLIALAGEHWQKYKSCPSRGQMLQLIKEAAETKRLRKDTARDALSIVLWAYGTATLAGKDFVLDHISTFARRCAVETAILSAAEDLDKLKFDTIEKSIKKALEVGLNAAKEDYNFFELAHARAQARADLLSGKTKRTGITTGFKRIDDLLYHGGWGRKELTIFMAPAKGGKSMTLVQFAANAVRAGNNVLYVTLEVSKEVIADRFDACFTGTEMNSLMPSAGVVQDKIESLAKESGALRFVEFPSGSLSPGTLRRLLDQYRIEGLKFDMVCVDYADLMKPDRVFDDPRENSRLVYVDLRALAQEFELAMLTATQTNREGFKAAVGKMEHVAEDINKARTTDLMISINATDDEKARGECRLFFAASRNQKGNITVKLKGNMSKAQIAQQVTAIEE